MRTASLLLLLLSVSCSSVWTDYQEYEADGLSMGALWTVSQQALEATLGVPLDKAHTDRGMHKMETKWRTLAAPFRKGERRRGMIELVRSDTAKETVVIRYAIEKQINKTIGSEFDPEESDWSAAGQDNNLEEHLRQRLSYGVARAQGKRVPEATRVQIEDPMKVDRGNRR